ncbi:hypothetical protein [Mycoplasmopsis gallinarum]|uniref:Uncharacterized protein n=1 Tax=Mycoplasmopsis gallinarum TaxID=29557 RepID=A0A168RRN2_9BACT|nr:hypothetical protein [Mycoplasmopsis gallinarum]OAB49220.1 hypothetical protein MGALLINA_00040 [Mycoplasmopsis gallinarum]
MKKTKRILGLACALVAVPVVGLGSALIFMHNKKEQTNNSPKQSLYLNKLEAKTNEAKTIWKNNRKNLSNDLVKKLINKLNFAVQLNKLKKVDNQEIQNLLIDLTILNLEMNLSVEAKTTGKIATENKEIAKLFNETALKNKAKEALETLSSKTKANPEAFNDNLAEFLNSLKDLYVQQLNLNTELDLIINEYEEQNLNNIAFFGSQYSNKLLENVTQKINNFRYNNDYTLTEFELFKEAYLAIANNVLNLKRSTNDNQFRENYVSLANQLIYVKEQIIKNSTLTEQQISSVSEFIEGLYSAIINNFDLLTTNNGILLESINYYLNRIQRMLSLLSSDKETIKSTFRNLYESINTFGKANFSPYYYMRLEAFINDAEIKFYSDDQNIDFVTEYFELLKNYSLVSLMNEQFNSFQQKLLSLRLDSLDNVYISIDDYLKYIEGMRHLEINSITDFINQAKNYEAEFANQINLLNLNVFQLTYLNQTLNTFSQNKELFSDDQNQKLSQLLENNINIKSTLYDQKAVANLIKENTTLSLELLPLVKNDKIAKLNEIIAKETTSETNKKQAQKFIELLSADTIDQTILAFNRLNLIIENFLQTINNSEGN